MRRLAANDLTHERTASDTRRQTLLHEMCHHGKRLLALGEEWARGEAKQYADQIALERNMLLTQQIRHRITDLAIDLPNFPWRTARRLLRAEFSEVFDRAAPWARGVWLREVSEIKAYRSRLPTNS
jgi:hypothetical protein